MDEYEFDYNVIIRDLFILLSIFTASKENNGYLKQSNIRLARFVEWEIIQESIISTAIRMRMIDDKFKSDKSLPFQNVSSDDDKELTLREACNKIIHAKKFEPNECIGGFYLEPIISLEGVHNSEPWKHNLDIKKYVTNGISFLTQYLQ